MEMEEEEDQHRDEAAENDYRGLKTLISFYSNYLWNRLAPCLPSSHCCNFLGKIIQTASLRRRISCLPHPLPSNSLVGTESSTSYDVLEDIMEHSSINLHNIQKNLKFWQSKAEGSNAQKLYSMVFERGPWAFVD